jgi:uncharacterized protein (TIGR02246 family)
MPGIGGCEIELLVRRAAKGASILLVITFIGSACAVQYQQAARLADGDLEAIRALHEAYRAAWLANDSAAVMKTLTEDAVLMPHHGAPVVEGAAAIREFWWPSEFPPATVTEFTTQVVEITGSGELGYLRGRFTLSFEYDGQTYSNSGNFLEIARKLDDGTWRIFRRIWNDPAPNVQ